MTVTLAAEYVEALKLSRAGLIVNAQLRVAYKPCSCSIALNLQRNVITAVSHCIEHQADLDMDKTLRQMASEILERA
jgi:hypothetical protein